MAPLERGEIMVRSPNMMVGYYNHCEATAAALDVDGWLCTGDMGYYDVSGRLFVTERLKSVIKCLDTKVEPFEVEQCVLELHYVAEVAVLGVAHPVLGEAPAAIVVLRRDWKAEEQVTVITDPVDLHLADIANKVPERRVTEAAFIVPSKTSPYNTAALTALENIVRNQQKALQNLRDQIQSQGAVIDKLTQLCQEREEIIHKQNDNIEKLTQLCQEQQLAKQQAKNLTKQEVEAVVEEKIVHVIETKLEALIESKLTVIVESKLEAILQAKLQPIHTQIGNKFTTLSHTMDTHTAQINEMKSQLTNFIAHVKNNYMSHAELEERHGRKKRRPHSKTPSRSNSLERVHVNAPVTPVDGKL
ncbi:hypothetical protein HPB49_007878 [Dermacentor silvarum]|uniref:Uncharacterized protein n=1 Tax=Dermacentor silvarum TaxID=543639 RepID=A0ACB8CE01_DERSI|nr:hypothetical protein HPB49_007878 [Dermacentor silvarum]